MGPREVEEDSSSILVLLSHCSSEQSLKSLDNLAEHEFWDLGFGEERLELGPLIYFVSFIETF